jgi:hydroxyethylthiazole kinase-like uncharacterized protein yjeF
MERAGSAAAKVAAGMLSPGGMPLVVAGPGNNGGDAFVVARLLKESGFAPTLVFCGDTGKLPHDARVAHDQWLSVGGKVLADVPERSYALAIDGLFGIGLARPLTGRPAELAAWINGLTCPVLALDIPSGLNADTGAIMGIAVRATRTISFIAGKPGLYTLDGPDQCGEVTVDSLGLVFDDADGVLNGRARFQAYLAPRMRNSHKGSYGSAGILGGSPGMAGAALLSGRAALKLGAGRVLVGMLDRLPVDPIQPELMLRDPGDVIAHATALAVGPGLGQSDAALAVLRRAVDAPMPLLADADALNLLAAHPVLLNRLSRREAPTLLTPHPLEAARLLGTTAEAVQSDRVAAALELARRMQAHVVLKGAGSILASPDVSWAIDTAGNPGLASGGSGDVLAGMAVALLAQGWPADAALAGAVHLHGCAADTLVATGIGPVGLAAGELIDTARTLLNRWIADA